METKIQRILLKYISIYDQLYSVYLQNNDSEGGFEFKREMNKNKSGGGDDEEQRSNNLCKNCH